MPAEPTLSTHYIRLLTDYLAARYYDLGPVLTTLDIGSQELATEVDRRIPCLAFNRALEVAIDITGDKFLGLHIGERVRPAHFGVLGYLLMSCDSPQRVMQLHQRWHQLFAGGEQAEYEYAPGRIWMLRRLPPDPRLHTRASVECSLASTLTFARWLLGANANPLEMRFPHAAPDDLGEYKRLFRCVLTFEAACGGMCMDAAVLNAALPQADEEMHRLMERKAQRLAAELGLAEDALLGRLQSEIIKRLAEAVPSLETTANGLDMSVHTLKRRLTERNSSFREQLDTVRRNLAMGYLADPQLSLIEIAYLLNFSEQSAFQRAFKRWTGRTPQQYRERLA